jgi:hypothetical protein
VDVFEYGLLAQPVSKMTRKIRATLGLNRVFNMKAPLTLMRIMTAAVSFSVGYKFYFLVQYPDRKFRNG